MEYFYGLMKYYLIEISLSYRDAILLSWSFQIMGHYIPWRKAYNIIEISHLTTHTRDCQFDFFTVLSKLLKLWEAEGEKLSILEYLKWHFPK